MRVAWIIAGDEGGGVAQAVRGLTSVVAEYGVTPLIFSLRDGPFYAELRGRGHAVELLGDLRIPVLTGSMAHKLRQLPAVLRQSHSIRPSLAAALARQRVHAIHVLWPNLMPLAATTAVRLGVPCFWELPNVLGKYPLGVNRRILQYYLKHFGVIPLANSRFTAASLGNRPVQPIVMYLGADERRFKPESTGLAVRAQLGIPPDAVLFAVVASLGPEKGQYRFLEAMACLPPHFANTHLLLVGDTGDSDHADGLRQLARSQGMADRLHLQKYIPDPERLYAAVDVAVNATVCPEAFGLSVVEAMMAGKPVLAHALGGPAETVVDGVTGWHVAEPTVEAFRQGILRALADRGQWDAMGASARAHAVKNYTLHRQAGQYASILRGRAAGAMQPRVAMVQDGARLHYMLPISLKRAGLLSALYTDWYNAGNWRSKLSTAAARLAAPGELRRMELRRTVELGGTSVYHGGLSALWLIAARNRGTPESLRQYAAIYRRVFGRLTRRGPLGRPAMGRSVVFAFSHMFINAPEINARLKGLGHVLLCDQPVVWGAEALRQREIGEAAFPGWERRPADDDLRAWAAKEQGLVPVIDAWTCPAEYTCRTLVEMGVLRSAISVIPYPADTAGYPFVDRAGRAPPLVVGFVGAVNLRKGAPWFLQAARLCDPRLVRFVMVGPVLLSEIGRAELAPHVELVGSVPRSEIGPWLAKFDIFFFPSTCEGSAGAVMEAMATGLSVVTSPNSGSVVRHGVDGYLGPYDQPEQYAVWLTGLALDEEKRLAMGRSAHERAKSFDIECYSREIAALVHRLVAGENRGGPAAEKNGAA